MNIYLSNENNFENNGLGFLNDCITSKVTEVLNGDYFLEFEYPINGHLSNYLVEENIVKSNVGNEDYQLFKITNVSKDFSKIKVYARHITYNLLDNILLDVYPKNLNAQAFGDWILKNTDYLNPFSFYSDITETKTARYVRKNPIETIMGNENNSMVNLFGGELKRDNFNIKMLANRGIDNHVKLLFGKNIKSIKITIDISSLYTKILPIGYDGLMLPETYVESPIINNYPTPKITKVEFSDIKYDTQDENAYQTLDEAYEALRIASNKLFKQGIDKPKINIKIDWLELSKTSEYKNLYSSLEKVHLGDIITANVLGLDYTTKVTKTIYNVLTDSIDKFEIGTLTPTIANTLNNQTNAIEKINPTSILKDATDKATSLITSAMGGFVYKTNEELYIMDNEDPTKAQKVWRWNINGLGYSSTGVNGPYGLAMTMDGSINADFITSGIIQTNRVEGLDSLILSVDNLKKDVDTEKTITSYPIEITDAGNYNIKKGVIYGKSEQEIPTTGKNICPTDFDIEWVQGQYTISGAIDNQANRIRIKRLIDVLPNTTYYVNTFSSDKYPFVLRGYNSNGDFYRSMGALVDGSTFTTKDGETKIGITIYDNAGGMTFDKYKTYFEDGTIKPFICLDSETNKTFEEYIPNGISPDYPSEVKTIKGIENLWQLNKNTQTNKGITYSYNEDGTFNLSGTATEQAQFNMVVPLSNSKLIVGKQYTINCSETIGSNLRFYVHSCTNAGAWKKTLLSYYTSTYTYTLPETTTDYINFAVVVPPGTTINFSNIKIQLEEGSIQHSIVPYGRWLSVKARGKNLFNYEYTSNYKTYSGATISKIDNGIRIQQTGSGMYKFSGYVLDVNPLLGKTLTLSCNYKANSNNVAGITIFWLNGINTSNEYKIATLQGNGGTFTIPKEAKYDQIVIFFYANLNGTGNANDYVDYTNIQLELGDTKTEFEPYKEPTISLIDMNKPNLFDKDIEAWEDRKYNTSTSKTNTGVKIINTANGVFGDSYYAGYRLFDLTEYAGKTITLSCNVVCSSVNRGQINIGTCNELFESRTTLNTSGAITSGKYSKTFNVPSTITDNNKYLSLTLYSQVSDSQSVAGDYVEYNDLKIYEGIDDYYEFVSINDVKDTYDLVSGVLTKNIKELVLTGNETFTENTVYSGLFMLSNTAIKSSEYDILVISTHFKSISQNKMFVDLETGYNNDLVISAYTNDRLFIVYKKYAKNLTGFKAYLKEQYDNGTPVVVQYILAKPKTIQLTPNNLELFKGYNYITIEDDVEPDNMEVEYLTDSYLNTQFATKSELTITSNSIKESVRGEINNLNQSVEAELELKVGRNENDQIISMINASAQEINLKSNRFSMTSDFSEIKKDGSVKFTGGTIGGFDIFKNKLSAPIYGEFDFTQQDLDKVISYLRGEITLTPEEITKYDTDKNGIVDIVDVVIMKQFLLTGITKDNPGRFEINTTNGAENIINLYDGNGKLRYYISYFNSRLRNLEADSLLLNHSPIDAIKVTDGRMAIFSPNVYSLGFFTSDVGQYGAFSITEAHNGIYDWGFDIWASDKRLKNSIKDTKVNGLDIVNQIKHRQFKYKNSDEITKIGYVADELEEIDKNMIFEVGEEKLKQPKESYIIPILSKAIQELSAKVEKLEKELEEMRNK